MEPKKKGKNPVAYNRRERRHDDPSTNPSLLGKRNKCSTNKYWPFMADFRDGSQKPNTTNGAEATDYSTHPSFLWPPHPTVPVITSQRLFATVSDPSMCHYPVPSVPINYAVEPISLPLYSLYAPLPNQAWRPNTQPACNRRGQCRQPKRNSSLKAPSTNPSWSHSGPNLSNGNAPMDGNSSAFASLPTGPAENRGSLPDNQRRFSDPGLGPSNSGLGPDDAPSDPELDASEFEDSDCSVHIPPTGNNPTLVTNLIDRVNTLHSDNRRLTRALRSARFELNNLKVQDSTLKELGYEPGMIAEMVMKVREATRERQETLMVRVAELVSNTPPEEESSEDEEDEKICDRLERVEEQLRRIHPYYNIDAPWLNKTENDSNKSKDGADPEREKLLRKLEASEKARQAAEARAQRLEQLLAVMREKVNTLGGKEKPATPSVSPEESLASLGSSCGSPQLTMSGPVTCL